MDIVFKELAAEIDAEVLRDITLAFELAKAGDGSSAIVAADRGWAKMPEPVFGWGTSLSYLKLIAKIYRDVGAFDKAITVLQQRIASDFHPDYDYHPYFLLGTVYYAMQDMESARHYMKVANKLSGGRCFIDEKAEYRQLLISR